MNHEEKIKTAIDQVYAAMPENKINRFVKDLIGAYNIQDIQSMEEQLRTHLEPIRIKK